VPESILLFCLATNTGAKLVPMRRSIAPRNDQPPGGGEVLGGSPQKESPRSARPVRATPTRPSKHLPAAARSGSGSACRLADRAPECALSSNGRASRQPTSADGSRDLSEAAKGDAASAGGLTRVSLL
jgi:hypothetical protein